MVMGVQLTQCASVSPYPFLTGPLLFLLCQVFFVSFVLQFVIGNLMGPPSLEDMFGGQWTQQIQNSQKFSRYMCSMLTKFLSKETKRSVPKSQSFAPLQSHADLAHRCVQSQFHSKIGHGIRCTALEKTFVCLFTQGSSPTEVFATCLQKDE